MELYMLADVQLVAIDAIILELPRSWEFFSKWVKIFDQKIRSRLTYYSIIAAIFSPGTTQVAERFLGQAHRCTV